ncbi:hypothetical protein Pint_14672 [Pistacia integerrima]|uniref:Uncharacterized protein n=1 Tax=Pistacia integerrima TaxID=434235 RepID=A0ACC0Y7Z3_9ROSI|nr:hypothetical protein Pint_14672 [Pistacia integerrima]
MNNTSKALLVPSYAKAHQLQLFFHSGKDRMQQVNPYWPTK